jgi:ABC-type transport system involved in cytochrome bd biosynthesis fused ATPase/permease subunit
MINNKFNKKFKTILSVGLLSLILLLGILHSNSYDRFTNSLVYFRENLDNKLKDQFNNQSSININNKRDTTTKKYNNNLESFECISNAYNEKNVISSNKLCNLENITNNQSNSMAQPSN